MSVWEAIRDKHAVREFDAQPIPEADMRRILNAGRRTQSGFNSQPWQFIAVTDKDKIQQLSKIGRSTGHAAGAAMVVVLLTPHAHDNDNYWRDMFDAGQAAAYMQLTAHELGIGSCPGSVYHPEMARDILGFPEEWDLKVIISFGYANKEKYPDHPPKTGGRKNFDDVIHWNGW
jgi:nitroreductase